MPLATLLKTVAKVTGTYLSIQEMFYFIPYYAWIMHYECNLLVTEIVKAGNFNTKIWKNYKKWA